MQLQHAKLHDRLKVWEAFDLFRTFYRRTIPWEPLLEQWGLDEKRNTAVDKLSGGQQQRLFIALALLNDPEIVFLDDLMTFLGTILLFVAGKLLYDLAFPAVTGQLALAIIVSALSFFAVGFVLAGLMPTPRTAQAVGMGLFYPMLFLSGAAVPRFIMPETVQRIAEFLPLTHVVILLEDLWVFGKWNLTSLAVIAGLLVISLIVSRLTFRWE